MGRDVHLYACETRPYNQVICKIVSIPPAPC